MLKIKIINYQTNQIEERTLTEGEHLIGRHPSCSLVLDSPEVSRVHGRILLQNGKCYYSDLGSTDGSRVNHEAIAINHRSPLNPDDMVRIGEFVIWVESLQPESTMPKSSQSSQLRHWAKGDLTVHCVQIIDQTPDVKTFRFMAAKPLLFIYKPGQFVTLELEIFGKKVFRSYSISSSPSRPLTLDITVKRVSSPDGSDYPPGVVSNWLHDRLQVGSQLKIKEPAGQFTCINAPNPRKLLMLSAGSGITPMMSMSLWLCDTATHADIVFFHSAPNPKEIIFRQELELMSWLHPNFRLAMTVTRPEPGDPWLGYRGRLNAEMLQTIAPDFCDRTVYVCGSPSFMIATKTLLENLGFPMKNYYEESFGGKKSVQPAAPEVKPTLAVSAKQRASTASSQITFATSGKTIDCDGEECILDVAEQAGIKLPSGCRMGACGACKQTMTIGAVKYIADPHALKPDEKQAGVVLTCVACPVGKVVLNA
jgi:glycine betaine catabolism B